MSREMHLTRTDDFGDLRLALLLETATRDGAFLGGSGQELLDRQPSAREPLGVVAPGSSHHPVHRRTGEATVR
jgi:hypothetical protein